MSELTVLLTDAQLERLAELVAARMPQPVPAVVLTDEQAYYTVAEAAAYLRLKNPQTIYNAVAAGEINVTPIGKGREYRISAEALRQYTNKAGAA